MAFLQLDNEVMGSVGEDVDENGPGFALLSSIRYDAQLSQCSQNTVLSGEPSATPSHFYMLSYHRDRILSASMDLAWAEVQDLLAGPRGVLRLSAALEDHLRELHHDKRNTPPLKVTYLPCSRKTS